MYYALENDLIWEALQGPSADHRIAAYQCGGDPDDHYHSQEECLPSYPALVYKLPRSETGIAQAIASIVSTSRLIYVPESSEWRIWDGLVYRPLSGDLFAQRLVGAYARIYETALDRHHLKGLAKHHFEVQQGVEDWEGIYESETAPLFSMSKTLATERGIRAVVTLLQSQLYQVPTFRVQSGFTTLADFLHEEVTPGLVEGLLPARGIGQLYGESYTGKTYAAVDLALSVASGASEWLGHKLNVYGPQNVLYIAAEGGDAFRKILLGWTLAHPSADLRGLTLRDAAKGETFSLTDSTSYGLDNLKRDWLGMGSPKLIIVDPQADVTAGVDENSKALADAIRPLAHWANEAGVLVLLVHHSGKDGSKGARGTSAQMAMMDVQMELSKASPDTRNLIFHKIKGEQKPSDPFTLEFRSTQTPSGSRAYVHYAGKAVSPEEAAEAQAMMHKGAIRGQLSSGLTSASAICTALKVDRNRIAALLKEMEADGEIQNTGPTNRPHWELVAVS